MKTLWWRIRLFILMLRYGYTPKKRWNLFATWSWTFEDCWIEFMDDGYTPMEALKEDMSYAVM
jgi:hypothetical protein